MSVPCMHACACACVCVRMHVCMCMDVCRCIWCVCVCVFACMRVYVHACICVYESICFVSVCMCVCMYTHVCVVLHWYMGVILSARPGIEGFTQKGQKLVLRCTYMSYYNYITSEILMYGYYKGFWTHDIYLLNKCTMLNLACYFLFLVGLCETNWIKILYSYVHQGNCLSM